MQDDKFGGGRGGAALLAWLVALLFYNTYKAVCLLNVNEAADEVRFLTYCITFFNTNEAVYQKAAILTGLKMGLLFHVFCLSFKETKRKFLIPERK